MTIRIVIHLGVHKTGSTLIQRHIHDNAATLRAQGVFCANEFAPRYVVKLRNNLRRLQNSDRVAPDLTALGPASEHVLQMATDAGAHTVLISEENIPGMPFHRQMLTGSARARLYPDAETCLRLVTSGFGAAPLKLLLYTRRQDSLLVSHYAEALTSLQIEQSLEEFVGHIDLTGLRFANLIERIKRGAPGAEISVTPFETISNGARAFLTDFFTEAGAEAEALTYSETAVRPRVSRDLADQLVLIARQFKAGGRPQVLKRQARRLQAAGDSGGAPLALPPALAAELTQRYQDDISYRPIATP